MKHATTAGAVLGLLALLLALAALATGGGEEEGVAEELGNLNASVSALAGRVTALKADLASAAGKAEGASKAVADLSARVERAELEAARLGKAVAEIPEPPAAAAATGPATDPGKLRELVQEQVRTVREGQAREMADRFRQGMVTRLRDDVGLGEEKAEKVVEAQRKAFEQMGQVLRDNRGDRDAVRRAMEDLQKKAEEEMAGFLTEDELAKLREWRDQQMQRWGGGNRGGRNRPPQDAGEGAGGGEGGGNAPAPF